MSMLITQPARAIMLPAPIALPAPRVAVEVRPGTMEDLPFIDALQKKHSRQLGYFHRKTLEGKIALGDVLVAEGAKDEGRRMRDEAGADAFASSSFIPHPSSFPRLGYVIGCDRYFKHDDVGIIYQLCVEPGVRRGLVGAALVKAMFDRAAYGCRLFCCWCAQDLEANHFWESLGFVPLAYRAGSEKKGKGGAPRIHIFWQKRIRPEDTRTAWWFPAKTDAGSMREDRIALPIPPGMHWSDELPVLVVSSEPRASARGSGIADAPEFAASLPDAGAKRTRKKAQPALVPGTVARPQEPTPHPRKRPYVQFGPPPSMQAPAPAPAPTPAPTLTETPTPRPERRPRPHVQFGLPTTVTSGQKSEISDQESEDRQESELQSAPRPRREKRKADPQLIAAARELRDRWLEKVDENPGLLLPQGKYEVARALPEAPDAPDRRLVEPRLIESEVKALPHAA